MRNIIILIILGIIITCFLGYKVEPVQPVEPFLSEIKIDKIQFVGSTMSEREKITSFPLPIPLETKMEPPPKNSDPEVKKELEFLRDLTLNRNSRSDTEENPVSRRKFAKRVEDEGVFKLFYNFAGNNGLVYDQKHLKKLAYDLETYCLRVQRIYKRPRPSQLAFVYQIPINVLNGSNSPSYPACPTFVAKVLAHVLEYNNPKHKARLHELAKKVELSRLYGGYNFPSDNLAALKMASLTHKYVKHLET
jgi:hypothetical protein